MVGDIIIVRPGRTTDEVCSIIWNFLKFTDRSFGAPSEKYSIRDRTKAQMRVLRASCVR